MRDYKEEVTRVPCISRIRRARMIFEGVEIGIVSEESNDAGEFDWVIAPNWENLKKVSPIQISGIDMDAKQDEYIRRFVPSFVEERTLPDNRKNLYEELQRKGLTTNDRYEFMCRNHGLCGKNDITVERIED